MSADTFCERVGVKINIKSKQVRILNLSTLLKATTQLLL